MTIEPAKIEYREAVAMTASEVRAALSPAPEPISDVADLLAATCGKGARTALLMASAMDENGLVPASAVHAAAAVELLHMATLVHDDIIDNAPVRRGQPSVQSRFGKEIAVLGGDWLLTLALRRALEVDYPVEKAEQKRGLAHQILPVVEKILLGEIMQRRHNGDVALSAMQYIRIIDGKTAALFCLAARAGAELGGCGERDAVRLMRFSRYLGIVFQIIDDLKDYTMEADEILKPARRDLVSGVVTMPLILSFLREPALKSMALGVIRGEADVAPLVRRVNRAKGIEATKNVASRCADKARGLISCFSARKQDALGSLLDSSLAAARA